MTRRRFIPVSRAQRSTKRKRSGALQTRDRRELTVRNGPGSAVHRFAPLRAAPRPGHERCTAVDSSRSSAPLLPPRFCRARHPPSSRTSCASALSACSRESRRSMETFSGAWPSSAIKKAGTLPSTTSRPRVSRATKQTIASSQRARSMCSWRSATSTRCRLPSRLRKAGRSRFWPSISTRLPRVT